MRSLFVFTIVFFAGIMLAQAQVKRKGVTVIRKEKSTGSAPAKFTINDLQGKWIEEKRTSGNVAESYTDTLLIDVSGSMGSNRVKSDMSMTMRGQVQLKENDGVFIGADFFTIKEATQQQLVLADDNYVHYLTKVAEFASDNYGKDSIARENLNTSKLVNVQNLPGKWEVYKRKASPGFITSNTVLVSKIDITSIDNNKGVGSIVIYTGENIALTYDATFMLDGNALTVIANGLSMQFEIYEADGRNLVFGQTAEVVNYAQK